MAGERVAEAMGGGLRTELAALRAGRTTFAAFAVATGGDWRRLAEYLHRRWWVPEGVESADVEQELLVSAWRAVESWDPERGVSLSTHVLWNAVTGAKKFLNRQRNALRRSDRAQGRFPVSFSTFPEGEEPGSPSSASTAEETAEAREQLTFVLGERLTDVERAVLVYVVASGGDLSRGARMVFSDPGLCLRARLGSEREARRLTAKVIDDVLRAATSRGSEQ